jgi:hypothetical protein
MNQRTHSWIAIRAIALLEDEDKNRSMVKLLKPCVRMASVGAWIPDDVDAKRGGAGSMTDNHILKTAPYEGEQRARFTCKKDDLLDRLGMYRRTAQFLGDDNYLDDQWWASPYKGDVTRPGQHLPNRAMAMGTMMKDLLLMGNKQVDQLIPGELRFTRYMSPEVRTQEEAAAMYFFMLSHFIADSSMPCHCDARKLAGYAEGLHKEWETYWSKKVGTGFEKKNLLQMDSNLTPAEARADSNQVLQQARDIDTKFGLNFAGISIPDLHEDHDVWLEMMFVCRASFAVASIIAPYKQYEYGDPEARAPFDTVFGGTNKKLLEDTTSSVIYDAVLNTAIVWKHIWNKVSKD